VCTEKGCELQLNIVLEIISALILSISDDLDFSSFLISEFTQPSQEMCINKGPEPKCILNTVRD